MFSTPMEHKHSTMSFSLLAKDVHDMASLSSSFQCPKVHLTSASWCSQTCRNCVSWKCVKWLYSFTHSLKLEFSVTDWFALFVLTNFIAGSYLWILLSLKSIEVPNFTRRILPMTTSYLLSWWVTFNYFSFIFGPWRRGSFKCTLVLIWKVLDSTIHVMDDAC